jgi:hypothetical protein
MWVARRRVAGGSPPRRNRPVDASANRAPRDRGERAKPAVGHHTARTARRDRPLGDARPRQRAD